MAGNISEGFTVFSNLSIAAGGPASGGGGASTGGPSGQTVALNGALLSIGTWAFSMITASSAAAIPSGCVGLLMQASGFSLVYKSGSTVYTIGASAVSA